MNSTSTRLVVVASFLDTHQAHVARLRLEAEGIRAALDGEHHIAMDWMISNAVGGVKLLVLDSDVEQATRILQEDETEKDAAIASDEPIDDDAESCPACQSMDFHQERLNRPMAFLSVLFFGFPLPFFSQNLACNSCGHRWRERWSDKALRPQKP